MKQLKHLAILALLAGCTGNLYAQESAMTMEKEQAGRSALTGREQSIVAVAALTAKGDLENLRTALIHGLDSGLTVNEIKDVLVQLYAYCGFPRSLNGINTFRAVLEARKAKGIEDKEGKASAPVPGGEKYERGRKTLEKLTGQAQPKPAKGFGEFSPAIDRFLKEHLFADIFDSDVLTFEERELATIAALTAMSGVEPQLAAHLGIGMNTGLTGPQINDLFSVVENSVGTEAAARGRGIFQQMMAGDAKVMKTAEKKENTTFPMGDRAPKDFFTGTVWLKVMVPKLEFIEYSIGNVTFEPGARSHWHTHPAGQVLLVTDGVGLYQEKGSPVRTIARGETIVCDPDIEHWHGASPESRMTHVAITNYKDGQNVVWLKPVTDEEYSAK